MEYPHLFEPMQLGSLTVRNRLMMTVHGGAPGSRNVSYFEARAAGGVGLMCVPGAAVGVHGYSPAPGRFIPARLGEFDAVPADPASPEGIAYFDERVTPMLRELAEACHRHGAVAVSQIHHLATGSSFGNMYPSIAPSAVRDEAERVIPHVLTVEEIETLVVAFGQAARRAREAGLDGVELHAAHGYLINQFLSPHTNRRTDAYGGSFDARLRLLREIIESVDRLAGSDFPVGLRITGAEPMAGGLGVEDVAAIVNAVKGRLMYANISGGSAIGYQGGVAFPYASPWLVEPGHNTAWAAVIRKATDLPVIVAGRILTPKQADELIAGGACDMVGMARALVADPEWPNKARAGKAAEIRPCIGNNECHAFHHGRGHMICTVNPVATREDELTFAPAERSRSVLVVGGGPAGMEAALVATLRGHRVTLCERESWLGGQARIIVLDPTQTLIERWLDYQVGRLDAAGTEIRLQTEVTRALVDEVDPEFVVLATGSRPAPLEFAGSDAPAVVTDVDAITGAQELGGRVVIVGGLEDHLRPLTLADVLCSRGHEVTVISELLSIGRGVEERTLLQVLKRLLDAGVELLPMTAPVAFEDGALRIRDVISGRTRVIEDVDSVVVAAGSEVVDELREELAGVQADVQLIGDCLSPRRLVHAILEGSRVAHTI